MTSSLAPREDFFGIEDLVYLASGQAGATLRSHIRAFERYVTDRQLGISAKRHYDEVILQARCLIAEMVGCIPDEVAFVSNVAHGVNLVADAINLSPGDNIVIEETEHPSAALPWLRQKRRGAEVRIVETGSAGYGWLHLADALDSRTRAVCVSHVSYFSGRRYDLEVLGDAVRRAGARLIIDASQSLGVIRVASRTADIVVSCGHKWLLGPHGIGILIWNRQAWPDIMPGSVGWHSAEHLPLRLDGSFRLRPAARRFEAGCPAFPNLYGLHEALGYLASMDPIEIEGHALALGARVISGLKRLGLPVITPLAASDRGGSVCFSHDDAEALQDALEERGVQVTAGHGRVRICTHVYNDEQQVDEALGRLAMLLGERTVRGVVSK